MPSNMEAVFNGSSITWSFQKHSQWHQQELMHSESHPRDLWATLAEDNWSTFMLQATQGVSHGTAKKVAEEVLCPKASMSPSTAHDIGTLFHNLAKIFKIHLLLTHKKNPLLSWCCDDPLTAQRQWHEETMLLKTFRFRCSVNLTLAPFAPSQWNTRHSKEDSPV